MNDFEKIRNQFNYARKEVDDINKFTLLWISFNCYYNEYISSGTDRNKIEKLKQDKILINSYLKLEQSAKNEFYRFINDRDLKGVQDLKRKKIIKFNDSENFPEFLEIIYTIRNNKIHGGKDPNDENDIYILIAASKILEIFLFQLYHALGIITD